MNKRMYDKTKRLLFEVQENICNMCDKNVGYKLRLIESILDAERKQNMRTNITWRNNFKSFKKGDEAKIDEGDEDETG